jgi:hypothetical protein
VAIGGDDDRLGLAVEDRLGPGARLLIQGGVEPTGSEAAADVGHGAERSADSLDDLLVGLAGFGPQQDERPIPLAAGERAGLCTRCRFGMIGLL